MSHSSRFFETTVLAVGSIALGTLAAKGLGLHLFVALVILLTLCVVARYSVALLVGLMAGWLPIAGRLSIVSLGTLPDLTAERAGAALLCIIVLVGRSRYPQGYLSFPKNPKLSTALVTWFLALMMVAISITNSSSPSDAIRQFVDVYLLPTLIIVLLSAVPWNEVDLTKIVFSCVSGAIIWVGLGFIEMATRRSPYTDTGAPFAAFASYVRPGGPFINPAALGLVLSCIAVLIISWLLCHNRNRLFVGMALGVLIVGIVVTLTRSAWIGLICGVLINIELLAPRSRFTSIVVIMTLISVVILAVNFVGQQTVLERLNDGGTALNRAVMYATAFRLSLRHPLTGLGIGAYRNLVASNLINFGSVAASAGVGVFAPHNSVLLLAVESGWVAALGLIMVFALVTAYAFETYQKSKSWISSGLIAILVCYAANAMFFDAELQVHSGLVLGLLIGPLIGYIAHLPASRG